MFFIPASWSRLTLLERLRLRAFPCHPITCERCSYKLYCKCGYPKAPNVFISLHNKSHQMNPFVILKGFEPQGIHMKSNWEINGLISKGFCLKESLWQQILLLHFDGMDEILSVGILSESSAIMHICEFYCSSHVSHSHICLLCYIFCTLYLDFDPKILEVATGKYSTSSSSFWSSRIKSCLESETITFFFHVGKSFAPRRQESEIESNFSKLSISTRRNIAN